VARPDYGVLVGLHGRLELAKSVKTLARKAARQLSRGKLMDPPGDNAAETYRTVLAYDADHREAKRGMHRIALALWARAERAMATKDREQAQQVLLQITAVEPRFSKLATLAKAISNMRRNLPLQVRLDLADDAYGKRRLAPPDEDNAYEMYRRILRDYPNNAHAKRGIKRVRDQLLTGGRRALDNRDVAEANSWLERALAADADADAVAELSRDIAYRRRLERAREGIFEEVLSLSDLNAVRRVKPKFPRTDERQGWVDVEFTVTEKGRVRDAVVKNRSVKGVFDDSALAALRRWRFEPVRENGRPIPVRVSFRFMFRAKS
ncbi:MAG: energy transducer TonB, partial [Pseudomonadales bacterium]